MDYPKKLISLIDYENMSMSEKETLLVLDGDSYIPAQTLKHLPSVCLVQCGITDNLLNTLDTTNHIEDIIKEYSSELRYIHDSLKTEDTGLVRTVTLSSDARILFRLEGIKYSVSTNDYLQGEFQEFLSSIQSITYTISHADGQKYHLDVDLINTYKFSIVDDHVVYVDELYTHQNKATKDFFDHKSWIESFSVVVKMQSHVANDDDLGKFLHDVDICPYGEVTHFLGYKVPAPEDHVWVYDHTTEVKNTPNIEETELTENISINTEEIDMPNDEKTTIKDSTTQEENSILDHAILPDEIDDNTAKSLNVDAVKQSEEIEEALTLMAQSIAANVKADIVKHANVLSERLQAELASASNIFEQIKKIEMGIHDAVRSMSNMKPNDRIIVGVTPEQNIINLNGDNIIEGYTKVFIAASTENITADVRIDSDTIEVVSEIYVKLLSTNRATFTFTNPNVKWMIVPSPNMQGERFPTSALNDIGSGALLTKVDDNTWFIQNAL